ncbi:hypothetical protein C4K46_01680 [Streptococcus oricebi]|uniref:Transposase n=1 Tax=Streptococcus oricebi TaxID=1547447 RepID=A0ABS5B1D5_9STRE|nr:hypothetical protein [Streptococcus oricebi]
MKQSSQDQSWLDRLKMRPCDNRNLLAISFGTICLFYHKLRAFDKKPVLLLKIKQEQTRELGRNKQARPATKVLQGAFLGPQTSPN